MLISVLLLRTCLSQICLAQDYCLASLLARLSSLPTTMVIFQ